MSSSVESIVSGGQSSVHELVDGGRALAQPVARRCAPRCARRAALSSSSVSVDVEPLRLAGLARAAPPAPRRACGSRRARCRAPRAASPRAPPSAPASTIVRPSFVPTTIRSRSDVLDLGERRVDDELAVDQADADGADRAEERQRRDHQRRRGAVDAEDVVRRDEVGRKRGADDLHLVPEALRPERPDRAVDHPRGQDRLLGRASLALEEAAGDLPGRVHPLLDVDGEREEVRALAGLGAARRGGEDHRVAAPHDDGAVGLLGELAGLHRDFPVADGHRDRRRVWCDRAHVPPISYGRRRRRFEAAPPDGAPSNFHPVSRGSFGPCGRGWKLVPPTSSGRAP